MAVLDVAVATLQLHSSVSIGDDGRWQCQCGAEGADGDEYLKHVAAQVIGAAFRTSNPDEIRELVGAPARPVPVVRIETADELTPILDAAAKAARVRALRDAATAWKQGAWADTPRLVDRVADRMATAQFAGDWLEARAAQEEGEHGE